MSRLISETQLDAYRAAVDSGQFDSQRVARAFRLLSHSQYRVNGRCDCPDATNREDVTCKHMILKWLLRWPDTDQQPTPQPASGPTPLAELARLWAEGDGDLLAVAGGSPESMWGVFSADMTLAIFHELHGQADHGHCDVCDLAAVNALAALTLRKVDALRKDRDWRTWLAGQWKG